MLYGLWPGTIDANAYCGLLIEGTHKRMQRKLESRCTAPCGAACFPARLLIRKCPSGLEVTHFTKLDHPGVCGLTSAARQRLSTHVGHCSEQASAVRIIYAAY